MSPIWKKITLIIMVVLIGAVILREIVLQPRIETTNFLRAGITIAGIVIFGLILRDPPQSFRRGLLNPAIIRKNIEPYPDFKIKIKGEEQSEEERGKKLFTIPLDAVKRKDSSTTKLFGTAGIRGLTNIEITPLLALKLSQVYADYLGNNGTVAVGRDTRYGAEMLVQTVSAGLMSGGIKVIDCGCIPTGGLANYIVQNKLSGGILITGSHMPYNMLGVIVIMSDGSYIPEEVAHNLEERFARYDNRQSKILPESLGKYEKANNPLGVYKEFLLGHVDKDLIRKKRYKVLIDPANGTAGLVLPDLLKELECEIHLINDKIQPVPQRSAEPRATNLQETAARVTEFNCQLGIATDIDADRVLFIDETGTVLSEDLVGSIFARAVLAQRDETSRLCVTPINSSGLIEHTCLSANIKLEYCPIGQPATLKVVKNLKANFSYEESGKYYFADEALWPDGIFASLKLLEIMAREGKPLSKLAADFPKFYQVKHTIKCDNQRKEKVMHRIFEIWQKEAIEGRVKDITIDGLKRIYDDKSWLLIRSSGTEPLIRVYADAASQARAEELVRKGESIVQQAMPSKA